MNRQTGFGLLLLAVVIAHVFLTPYTKVEESFNVQAIHDLMYHRLDLQSYDHFQFPGVVPRTFLGAAVIAAISAPAVAALHLVGLPKLYSLWAVRGMLGCLAVASLAALQRSVSRRFGALTGVCLLLLTALQFHMPFYMSRPLPNVLAMVLTNLALADWVEGGHPRRAVALLTVATAVFRCDVLLLLGLVSLQLLASRQLHVGPGVAAGLAAAALSVAASVGFDSWLWGRWLWPEGEVFWFNTVLNKSSEWGVMPWGWYFTSALPRALHAAYLLAPLGAALDRRARPMFSVALLFVVLYSNLGHKEVRFLLPVLPLWNTCAAVAVQRTVLGRSKSTARRLLFLALCTVLAGGAGLTALSVAASAWNYPGGVALARLHELGTAEQAGQGGGRDCTQSVHIAVLPAMTGVSRFSELGPPWAYSKEEGLSAEELSRRGFKFLLTDLPHVDGYTAVGHVHGFAGLHLPTTSPLGALKLIHQGRPPLNIVTNPQVHILQRHNAGTPDCEQRAPSM